MAGVSHMTCDAASIAAARAALTPYLERTPVVRVDAAKDHGTAKSIEGVLNTGDRVLLVEDVVTTGGASLTAVDLLQNAGATVAQVVAVVDREQGGRERFEERGVPFTALFTATELGLTE